MSYATEQSTPEVIQYAIDELESINKAAPLIFYFLKYKKIINLLSRVKFISSGLIERVERLGTLSNVKTETLKHVVTNDVECSVLKKDGDTIYFLRYEDLKIEWLVKAGYTQQQLMKDTINQFSLLLMKVQRDKNKLIDEPIAV